MGLFQTILTLLIFVPMVAILLAGYLTAPLRGNIVVSNIKGDAMIRFEGPHGIPYITGSSKESVMFALGFVHAMDRLYDMHSKRAMAYGKFSEV